MLSLEGGQPVRHRWAVGKLERPDIRRMDSHLRDHHQRATRWNPRPHALMIAPGDYERWLSDEPDPDDLLQPYPAEPTRMWPISTRVNKPENDDSSILEPIKLSAAWPRVRNGPL